MARPRGPQAAERSQPLARAPDAATGQRRLTIDAGWRITGVSEAAAAWFGAARPDAVVGLDARRLLPKASPGFIAMQACLTTRQLQRAAFRSDFFPERRVEAEFRPHGAGVEVLFWDVRERPSLMRPSVKSAARPAAQRSAARRAARPHDRLEFTLSRDWTITSITKAAAAWAGSTVEDLVGRSGRDVNPAATAVLGDAIEAALRTGKTTVRQQPSTHVPGRWVRIEVGPHAQGARVRFEDITAPASAQDGERDSRTLRPAEIVLLDQRGVIVAANGAWRAAVLALGLELGDAGVGVRYAAVASALVKGIDEAELQARLDELLCGRLAQFEATYEIETTRGHELRQVRIAPLRIGETTHFSAIHEDLTERAKILATLNETSDQLLHAQEMERQRIAIELHDSMSQHLAGLVMCLAQLRLRVVQDQGSQALIDDMAKLTQLAIRETRVLSYLMNAAGDEDEGLETSVRRFIDGYARRTGLHASFHTEGSLSALSAEARHTVFRITQEALSNVYRHAGATEVSVSLVCHAGVVTVRIKDDGRGIERAPGGVIAGEPPLGVGILGMRARIEQLGGSLDIRGGAGGTMVSATIPQRSTRQAAVAVG